jgi:nucleoside-diphosphate-sugar epimerase
MRVLLTGSDGYLGTVMSDELLTRGHDVVGLDAGFHRSGWLYHGVTEQPRTITRDTRDLQPADLEGFDALVHLGELSNDPLGQLDADLTFRINHEASLRVARLAKAAGVQRFVQMSSCSVYGASGDRASSESSALEPLTAYAQCKVLVERDVAQMADDNFSPTFMRNATAFGASPRLRFDLVVNNLAGWAWTTKEIRMESDGSPWRPFVHARDIAHAVACVLAAPRDVVHNEVFNVGDNKQNYQIRTIADIIASAFPGCSLHVGELRGDRRNYRVDFEKINTQLPGFSCRYDVERGAQELYDVFSSIELTREDFQWRGYTRLSQIRWLLDTGQLDADLRWRTAAA